MTTQEMLAHNLELTYTTVRMNTDGMSQADSLVQPAPGGNCAAWILAHLTLVHGHLLELVGEPTVDRADTLARVTAKPITDGDGAPDFVAVRETFLETEERCLRAVRRLTDEVLADPLPDPFGGRSTRAEILSILANHGAYHAGQLGLSRRLAGMEGAVRGPGE